MVAHRYGGIWTREKLKILNEYAKVYSQALKNQSFTLHYADIFAGTGRQDLKEDELQLSSLEIESLDGSVSQMIENGFFHRFHFNDLSPDHCKDLQDLVVAKGIGGRSNISCCDANRFVFDFVEGLKWNDRVLMFIDPYSTQLEWESLQCIAGSGKIDAILLFPSGPVLRLLPRDQSKLLPSNVATLDRLWGKGEWQEHLYRDKEAAPIKDLFEFEPGCEKERVEQASVEAFTRRRLDSIFPFVEGPHPLYNSKTKLFNLYFCCANPSPRAWGLAKKLAGNVFMRAKLKGL